MSFKPFLAYSASAGSGKTYALSLRYLALLFLDQSPSSILAATFTKKAANEMKQRVIKFLTTLNSDKELLEALCAQSGLSKEQILNKQKSVLDRFLKETNYIVTLDSFFGFILRSNALNINLEPDFKVKENIYKTIDKELIKELTNSDRLNFLVKLSINTNRRKTTDLVDLLAKFYEIDAILPNKTYEPKNIDAIKDKILALKNTILQEVIKVGASKSAVDNFKEENFKKFITKTVFEKESLYEHRLYKKYLNKAPQIETLFLELKSAIKSYHIALEETILYYLFELYNSYKMVRLNINRAKMELDFNDILYYTHRLIAYTITKEFLYFKLDTKFKHILLDEFQDTSILQFLILKPLIDEIFSGFGVSEFRSFFYVGDTKQSLYRFRGGVEELFDYVAKKYGIEVLNLDKNYRSARLLVEQTNSIFKNLIKGYTPQIPISSNDGYFEVTTSEDLILQAKEKIEYLLSNGVLLDDIALLVFTNKDGVLLQDRLKQEGITTILKTSSSLKHSPKIAALVGVLEYFIKGEPILIEPFLQKIGKSLEEIDLSFLKIDISPFDALDKIVKEFNYFENDLNILKLLDFARDKATILEFLEEFENSKIELVSNTQRGAKIMTIHSSKGLEFNYVILLDRFSKAPNRGEMFLFKNKDVVKIDKIFYRHSKKENFLKEYKEVLQEDKELSIKDKLNLLYVALTRAKDGLITIKKPKNSEFDILNLEQNIKMGSVIKSNKVAKKEIKKLDAKPKFYGLQEVEVKSEDSYSLKDFEAIYFGEAMHYALELINFKNPNIDSAIDGVKNRYGVYLSSNSIDSIKKRVNMLFNSSFLELIDGAKLYKEQPIVYNKNFYQIDLLAKFEDKNIIIDYKSSLKFQNKHITQVKNYINAINSIEKSQKNLGYIVYLLEDKIELFEV